MINDGIHHDPRRITFTASRYKFVSKMLSRADDVIEVGCGDGFMSRIVLQEVKHLDLTDFDESFVIEAQTFYSNEKRVEVFHHDLARQPFSRAYNAIYTLDVLKHVPPDLRGYLHGKLGPFFEEGWNLYNWYALNRVSTLCIRDF